MTPFKIGLLIVFGVATILGVGIFAMSKGGAGQQPATVVVWGTIPQSVFQIVLKQSPLSANKNLTVLYEQKKETTFEQEFIEALSEGRGPDVVLLGSDRVYKNRNRILPIPLTSYPERTFKDTFIEQGELFITRDGILGLPFMTDPLVMYWNKDMLSGNLIVTPPQFWEEIYPLVNTITKKDNKGTVTQSAVALGEWRNVDHAKAILATLLFQAGTPVVSYAQDRFVSALEYNPGLPVSPVNAAVGFYTQFSNPTAASYSWNRSLPGSLNMFLAGKLALYFGFASELETIRQKNPNLNFDATYMPQAKNTQKKQVFGQMTVLALVKQSRNVTAAFEVMNGLTDPAALSALEAQTNLPPVRKDMLAKKPTDAFRVVFYNSALLSRSFMDPDAEGSQTVFQNMIESITSGKETLSKAVSNAQNDMQLLLQ